MYIAQIVDSSTIYGVGNRMVIWVQGCSLRCPGCWNATMWEFGKGNLLTVETLILQAIQIPDIEGVTILGGEPFDQYAGLLQLAMQLKNNGLTVMIYTGYEMQELETKNYTEIFAYTDILITGRYDQARRNTNLQWIGSDNQQIHFLSPIYADYVLQNANYTEIQIDEFGQLQVLGFPDKKDWKDIF